MFIARRRGAPFNPQWEQEYLFMECGYGAICLVCGAPVTSVKKYNIERHYKTSHASEYGAVAGEDRVNLVKMLKEETTQIHEGDDNAGPSVPVITEGPQNSGKRMRMFLPMKGGDAVDFPSEHSNDTGETLGTPIQALGSHVQALAYAPPLDEDEFSVAGRHFACQLKAMAEDQRLLAQKIIGDVLYSGRVGRLYENCFRFVPPPSP